MSHAKLEGGCQCGTIRYEIVGDPVMASICHCSTCRRASTAASISWVMFKKNQVTFTQAYPARYSSSAKGERGFCPACGTQICLTAAHIPGLIDITLGSLDTPEVITPSLHYWGTPRLPWPQFAYSIPKFREPRPEEKMAG